MSFFRVLLALLISGAIAYGLYRVVDGQGVERAVEAVRTEIEEPQGAASGTETASLTEPSALTENPSDTDEGESAETPGEAEESEAAAASTETEEAETAAASTEAEQPAEATESAAAAPESDPTDEGESAETADDTQTAAAATTGGDSASGSGWAATVENSVASGSGLDQPMDAQADPTDEGESAETETAALALPSANLAANTSGSVDALKIVTGGMKYREALATLTDSGWQPRTVTEREGEPNAAEAALLEAGYGELEGCKGEERPICRFEFVDGEKQIAAVITAGTGTDPRVIDAFLMDIRAE